MKTILFLITFLFSFSLLANPSLSTLEVEKIQILNVNGSINPATYNYLKSHLEKLKENDKNLAIIKLNTPGGLVSTTKEILTLIGESKSPIVIWITPEGASATSAGAIIASSAHILVMSEGTNIGAATPIGLGGDIKESDGRSKAINDLVALVRSFAHTRGRNESAFEKMITDAASYTAAEASKEKIIDGIINSQASLFEFLETKTIRLQGNDYKIKIHPDKEVINREMDIGQTILDIFANPSTAYILFMIGAALVYFEFQAPGGFIAGSLGVVFLVIAGIGFQVLPLNIGAIALIILAFVLFILEMYITSYGILSLGGVAALVFGSLFLYRTENAYLDIELPLILSTVIAIVAYVLFVSFVIVKTRGKRKEYIKEKKAHTGSILKILNETETPYLYQIKTGGEIWKAQSDYKFSLGDECEVLNEDNTKLILTIKPKT